MATMDLIAEIRMQRQLPDRARKARRAAGVSQERMARELGVNRITLVRWEAGSIQPRPTQRARWLDLVERLEREVAAA